MEKTTPKELQWLDTATRLLDNSFRIPGTEIRFGFDFLIGLIPGFGDIVSLGMSGLLVGTMVRKGASGMVVVKMMGNIFLDAIVGAVPLVGDIFDLAFRANRRNLHLLQAHYTTGEHQGSAWPVVILIVLVLSGLIIVTTYLIWQIVSWCFGLLFA